MLRHNCSQGEAYLIPPSEYVKDWKFVIEWATVRVKFCPFCGERLSAEDTSPRVVPGAALEHVTPIPVRSME